MIRIGRGSKEQPEESNMPERNSSSVPQQQYRSANPANAGQALTESETMARDIKEGRLSGFVGSGTVLTGETNFQAMLRIDGHVTGSVASEDGTLVVGSTGRVDANINVAVAIVNGIINGDIIATEKLELGRTAKVAGNVQAPRLTIEDGAVFEGSCSMLKAQENLEKRKDEMSTGITQQEVSPYETSAVSSSDLDEPDEVDDDVSADEDDEDEDETAEAATS